jgi:hypothetical protein
VVDAFVVLTTTEEYRLSQLEPETQSMVRQLIQELANQGLQVQVGQTLRTTAQEKAAIDAGRSAVKTASWHQSGRAVDLYPIDPDSNQPDLSGHRLPLLSGSIRSPMTITGSAGILPTRKAKSFGMVATLNGTVRTFPPRKH